jgi:hypothetical protein
LKSEQHLKFCEIILEAPWFLEALETVRELELDEWCIGAGAVRNLVWDYLHKKKIPSFLADVDVAYFSKKNTDQSYDRAIEEKLSEKNPAISWEVTNQANVHLWFESHFGYSVPPLLSLEDAIATWPETATAIGVRLLADNTFYIFSPFGLADLFDMKIRRNPRRIDIETYRKRILEKKYLERWPEVEIILE